MYVSSYQISGGISCRSTGRGTAVCPSGSAGEWTALKSVWRSFHTSCTQSFFPLNKIHQQNEFLWLSKCQLRMTVCDNAVAGSAWFVLTWEWTFMCCSKLTAWPKLFLQMLHPKGRVPLWERLTWTSSPWGVENTWRTGQKIAMKLR